ncbi:hypothetical protein [Tunicatimonas pelagia]|uniref:hypothetical protein n=1 Tax=Tunicatimonas pelagia TaxID=931531 RepID=UPI0026661C15|nr:hypothetical protein [Tunicatimonas pelagia]WKN44143.1 hypothetical protein P0M28_04070 [Tunicatimonas pelagia]
MLFFVGSNVGGMQHLKFIGFLGAFLAFFLGTLVLSKQRKHTIAYLLLSIVWLVVFIAFTFNRVLG